GRRFSATKFRVTHFAAGAGNPAADSQRRNRGDQRQQSHHLARFWKFLLRNERADSKDGCYIERVDELLGSIHVGIEPLLGFGVELWIKVVIAMLSEIEDRPRRSRAKDNYEQAGIPCRFALGEQSHSQDQRAYCQPINRQRV